MKLCVRILSIAVAVISGLTATAVTPDSIAAEVIYVSDVTDITEVSPEADTLTVDSLAADSLLSEQTLFMPQPGSAEWPAEWGRPTIYDYPYSRTFSIPDWKRLWVNTAVMVGGGITTMAILEALPADATAWNKSENAKTSMWKRWVRNVKDGPHWDGDNPIFNFVLHPYAGAAYYMGARSAGFNCWGSFVYSFCISNIFWEYGFEAFNEIPSVQDIIITPVVGSLLGEGFYLIKRHIVSNGYRLWGSKPLGYAVAFIVDPLNEVVGYFRGDQRRACIKAKARSGEGFQSSAWMAPSSRGIQGGISITYNF